MSLLKRLEKMSVPENSKADIDNITQRQENKDKYTDLKLKIHKEIIGNLDKEIKSSSDDCDISKKVQDQVSTILERDAGFLPYSERQIIASDIIDEVLGLGPLESLLKDDSITEIMVNGPYMVYVEQGGKLKLTGITFRDDEHVLHIIDKIVSPIGRRIDESMPMVDGRLPDGSRVNAIIHPLSLKGPCITIRKFSKEPYSIHDLIKFKTLTPNMAKFIEACVKGRLNIIISGGTGSGKTTTLNVLSSFIPNDDRIVTIEDAAELQLNQQHVITLETRPPNIEGKGSITIRDLVRNSLRMRPDRIIVGEVRSGEALDMLQAMNTGHDGSLTTGHANSPRDMLSRLETMVLMAGMDLPVRAIREQISSAINLIIQQNRLRDGSRMITHITEIIGMEGDVIVMQDIFKFIQDGIDDRGKIVGNHKSTGIVPKFMENLGEQGITLPKGIFSSS